MKKWEANVYEVVKELYYKLYGIYIWAVAVYGPEEGYDCCKSEELMNRQHNGGH